MRGKRIATLFVLSVLLSVGCDDASITPSPSPSAQDIGPRAAIKHAIKTLRAQTVPGAFLIVEDWDNENAWVQFSVNDDGWIFLDMTSVITDHKDASGLAHYEIVANEVKVEQATTTVILSPDQVDTLLGLLRSKQLEPIVTHLAAKFEDGRYQGYQRSEQAVVHYMSDDELTDLIFSILDSVHGSKAISGFDIRLGNSRPPDDRGPQ